ncbi:15999_t:CDS:1 [Acaulospora morrowiae]|uniref:15999_t:CDS:1 n=1 Tax=Acaulospora morrowiae TaxID=94023 RepID=A0A9N8ZCJ2_9GLOM|nr:15999_t:CDS:1 [Acaulospora morrowiae]
MPAYASSFVQKIPEKSFISQRSLCRQMDQINSTWEAFSRRISEGGAPMRQDPPDTPDLENTDTTRSSRKYKCDDTVTSSSIRLSFYLDDLSIFKTSAFVSGK